MFMHPFFSLVVLTLFLVFGQAARPATAPEHVAAQPLDPVAREFLEAHNNARAEVGVEPLQWSEEMSKFASLLVRMQRDKFGCKLANLNKYKYGSNQDSGGMGWTPSVAVGDWVGEKEFYSYKTNTCVAPSLHCWHYTQVVWRKSKQVGCAQVTCVNDALNLTICLYNPSGNVRGERPY